MAVLNPALVNHNSYVGNFPTYIKISDDMKMSYTQRISARKAKLIFGTAYPKLRLDDDLKCNVLELVLYFACGLEIHDWRQGFENHAAEITVRIRPHGYDIHMETRHTNSYDKCITIENYIKGRPAAILPDPMRRLSKTFHKKDPIDSYKLATRSNIKYNAELGKMIYWLTNNARPSDYQIYSRFQDDISVGFRNNETYTMFKLMADI
jgi:hypothetical protein